MRDLFERLNQGAPTSAMTTALLLASVLVPLLATSALWVWLRPDRTQRGAIALATTWNAVWLLAFNVVAVQVGWWEFHHAGPAVGGVSIILWISWVVLWGPLTAGLTLLGVRPRTIVAALGIFDLAVMPLLGDVLTLGHDWILGEVVLLLLVAYPGLLLAQWTANGTKLRERVLLQVAMFAGLLLWAIPFISAASIGHSLTLDVPTWMYGAAGFALVASSLPALTAVYDFYVNGGTPWPWDTTDRPVRSGPYRYLRSPMQASALLVLVVMAVLYREPILLVAALSCVLYSRLFCELEAADLGERFGTDWTEFALSQRRWIPTRHPSAHGERGTIWINAGCEMCSPLGDFLAARASDDLEVANALAYSGPLYRVRYERADGHVLDGVRAVGAALEHLHLGWAFAGWVLRAPVLWRAWQLIGDAVGFGPRPTWSDQVDNRGCRAEVPKDHRERSSRSDQVDNRGCRAEVPTKLQRLDDALL